MYSSYLCNDGINSYLQDILNAVEEKMKPLLTLDCDADKDDLDDALTALRSSFECITEYAIENVDYAIEEHISRAEEDAIENAISDLEFSDIPDKVWEDVDHADIETILSNVSEDTLEELRKSEYCDASATYCPICPDDLSLTQNEVERRKFHCERCGYDFILQEHSSLYTGDIT